MKQDAKSSSAATAAPPPATVADSVRNALRPLLAGQGGNGLDAPDSQSSPQPSGFSEAQSPFGSPVSDATRFNDSVRLARAFSEIDRNDDRQLILALASLLAQSKFDP